MLSIICVASAGISVKLPPKIVLNLKHNHIQRQLWSQLPRQKTHVYVSEV